MISNFLHHYLLTGMFSAIFRATVSLRSHESSVALTWYECTLEDINFFLFSAKSRRQSWNAIYSQDDVWGRKQPMPCGNEGSILTMKTNETIFNWYLFGNGPRRFMVNVFSLARELSLLANSASGFVSSTRGYWIVVFVYLHIKRNTMERLHR